MIRKLLLVVIALAIGFVAGTSLQDRQLTPVEVEHTEYGTQITYADGTGYWIEKIEQLNPLSFLLKLRVEPIKAEGKEKNGEFKNSKRSAR